ncbi:MAG: MBL fold metallo-hydrolase [Deltaproteobacteria bacterium]|nr:MBL fold metallo-hydrolase [Deltaproteobacteria bacterium]MBW2215429.1 MBL fold metallo-hydrolase [Deltaproteobacteria bacterium]MBW2552134.1 MBL fold metallo-hydrolase [Deltaproteobacteria bacterium]MBW2629719.1 MBL fold metallo-hydrolase [Deltaproteobacteria bacterium]MBW2686561.1 MBL fold metallo-hydrolase [Deltaproteobacteria bacterium]
MTKSRIIALVVLATAGLLTTGALAFQPPGPSRRSTSFKRAHASTWSEVFASPRPIRVETLDTGIVHFPKELLLNGDHPAMDGFVDDGSPLRVFAHLVRHEHRGDVLIDTGLDDVYATEPLGHMRGIGRLVMGLLGLSFSQRPGQDVHTQLRNANAELAAIYFTHLHSDHATALPTFDQSLPLYTGAAELDDLGHRLNHGLVDDARILRELDFANAVTLDPLGRAIDLYGDGSFWAISTPGHTTGHVSYLVNGHEGPVLLTGDACHMRWGLEHGVSPSGATPETTEQAQASLDSILAFIKRYPQVRVVLGHQTL